MPAEITMPQQSDTMTEGTLVKWLKKEGDKVRSGEIVAEIETDKATMEMESFEAGTLAVILVKEGEKAPVGGAIAVLAVGKETVEEVKKQRGAGSASAAKGASAAQAAGYGSGTETASAASSKQEQAIATATLVKASTDEIHEPGEVGHGATREKAFPVPPLPAHHSGNGEDDRIRVSPLARRIALDKQVDLKQVKGSGPAGRIVQKDIEAYLASGGGKSKAGGAGAASVTFAPKLLTGQTEKIQLTKMRTAIATALQRSKQNIPHFYETIDIDVEEISRLREKLNAKFEKEKIRISLGDFITQAVAAALKLHPVLNSTFDANKNEITRYGDVNLGVAVSLPDGLIVPVLRGVDQMGLKEIRQRSVDLVERARAQKLKSDEGRGATFTISSLGAFGIREFSAIVNPPEVGILAVGAAEKRAVVRDGQIVARTMLTVTLSADHRVVDGADAAAFLRTLKELLEYPGLQLA